MKWIFYGAMVLEGITALIWATVAMTFFHGQPQLAVLYGATPSIGVQQMSIELLGTLGLILTIIGVVVCPITTGDTALRGARITIADELHLNQDKIISRVKIALPLFLVSYLFTFIDFTLIWRYFAWAQLISASILLFAATVYLIQKEKLYIITLAPAILCTLVTGGYILQAPEGLALDQNIANTIAVISTIIITALFLYKYKIRERGIDKNGVEDD